MNRNRACVGIILPIGILIALATTIVFFRPSTAFRLAIQFKTAVGVKNRVVQCGSGWRFLQPELVNVLRDIPADNIDKIVAFDRELRAHGTALVVVPIPNKIDIYPEKFMPFPPPLPINKNMQPFIDALERRGVMCVNLAPEFTRAKHEFPVFDSIDSHWTPLGIERAAKIIAQEIDSALTVRHIARDARYTVCDTVMTASCDLLDKPGTTAYYPLRVHRVVCENGCFYSDDKKSEILILGDSFTDRARWWNTQLGAQIAQFIKHPTRTYSSLLANTEGPSMYQLKPRIFPRNGIVIWAFASRVLQYHLCGKKIDATDARLK